MTPSIAGKVILLVDDDEEVRQIFSNGLRERGGLVHTTADVRDAVSAIEDVRPSVVIADFGLPHLDGARLCAEVRRRWPKIHVIILTAAGDSGLAIKCLHAGARGFLTKDISVEGLCRAVAGVMDGEAAIPRELADALITELLRVRQALTEREVETLRCLKAGDSMAAIRERFALSGGELRALIDNLFDKLGVSTRTEAVAAARKLMP